MTMNKKEFIAKAWAQYSVSAEVANKWMAKHPKSEYTQEDLENLFRQNELNISRDPWWQSKYDPDKAAEALFSGKIW